jgi:hypothetical protein
MKILIPIFFFFFLTIPSAYALVITSTTTHDPTAFIDITTTGSFVQVTGHDIAGSGAPLVGGFPVENWPISFASTFERSGFFPLDTDNTIWVTPNGAVGDKVGNWDHTYGLHGFDPDAGIYTWTSNHHYLEPDAGIYYEEMFDPQTGGDMMIIQWNKPETHGGWVVTDPVVFQVQLFECGSVAAKFSYFDLTSTGQWSWNGIGGNSVGYFNGTAYTDFQRGAFGDGTLITVFDGQNLCSTPPPPPPLPPLPTGDSNGGSNLKTPPTIGTDFLTGLLKVKNGFGLDGKFINVDSFWHKDFGWILEPDSHTFDLRILSEEGADSVQQVDLFTTEIGKMNINDHQWRIKLVKDYPEKTFTTEIFDPDNMIGNVTVSTITDGLYLNMKIIIDDMQVTPTNIALGVGLMDWNLSQRFIYFNDGITVRDIFSYPIIDTKFDQELRPAIPCVDTDRTDRYSCIFKELVKNEETKAKEKHFKPLF